MKILKQLAVAAVASAVLLTGCQNSFTGTTRDLSVLGEINRSAGANGITSAAASGTLVNSVNQQIVLTFSEPVDTATLASAVTVYPVTGTVATTLLTRGTAIPFTYQYSNGNTVTLLGNLSSVTTDTLEVYINPAVLTARNGAYKLNLDGDKTQGEAGDDDAYLYITGITQATVTSPTITAATGLQRNPRLGMSFTGGFGISLGSTSTDVFNVTYTNTYAGVTDTADYSSLLSSNIVIEKYVPVANAVGSWTAVTKGTVTHPTATGYVIPLTGLVEGDVVRARITNVQTLATTTAFSGFVQKFVHLDTDAFTAGLQAGYALLSELQVVAPTKITVDAAVDIELTSAQQNSGVTESIKFDSNDLNGAVVLALNNTVLGSKGIDTATILPANIKLVDTNGNSISWTSYKVTKTDTTGVATEIALYLDPTYQKQSNTYGVYLTSGLKTLAGSTGTAPVTLARYFGNKEEVNTLPALIGTRSIGNLTF